MSSKLKFLRIARMGLTVVFLAALVSTHFNPPAAAAAASLSQQVEAAFPSWVP